MESERFEPITFRLDLRLSSLSPLLGVLIEGSDPARFNVTFDPGHGFSSARLRVRGTLQSNGIFLVADGENHGRVTGDAIIASVVTLEIDGSLDPEVVAALEAQNPTFGTQDLGHRLYAVGISVRQRLGEYFRNIKRNYWADHVRRSYLDPQNWALFLAESHACWARTRAEASFRPLGLISIGSMGSFDVPTLIAHSLSVAEQPRLVEFLGHNRSASMIQVLLANSLHHIELRGDTRMAVIEAAIALEAVVKQKLAPRYLAGAGAPPLDLDLLDKIFKDAGTKAVLTLFLRPSVTAYRLSAEDIDTAIKAVETRNELIHGPRREVEIADARRYVEAICRIADAILAPPPPSS